MELQLHAACTSPETFGQSFCVGYHMQNIQNMKCMLVFSGILAPPFLFWLWPPSLTTCSEPPALAAWTSLVLVSLALVHNLLSLSLRQGQALLSLLLPRERRGVVSTAGAKILCACPCSYVPVSHSSTSLHTLETPGQGSSSRSPSWATNNILSYPVL